MQQILLQVSVYNKACTRNIETKRPTKTSHVSTTYVGNNDTSQN
jgi:hypothetical protein